MAGHLQISVHDGRCSAQEKAAPARAVTPADFEIAPCADSFAHGAEQNKRVFAVFCGAATLPKDRAQRHSIAVLDTAAPKDRDLCAGQTSGRVAGKVWRQAAAVQGPCHDGHWDADGSCQADAAHTERAAAAAGKHSSEWPRAKRPFSDKERTPSSGHYCKVDRDVCKECSA